MNGFEGTEEEWLVSLKGDAGRSIINIILTSSEDNFDIYTITYSDNTTSTFAVRNGINGVEFL